MNFKKVTTALPGLIMALGVIFAPAALRAEDKPAAYPLDTCPMSGKKHNNAASTVHEGREVKFCCKNCAAGFAAKPDEAIKKVDAAIIAAQKPHYPSDKCAVSNNKLGEHGDPVDIVVANRLIRLCCDGCVADAKKDSAKIIAKLDEAVIAKESKDYPLTTCPVSDHALDSMGKPVDIVHGGRLVKLCCKGCVEDFAKDPAKCVAKIEAARAAKAGK